MSSLLWAGPWKSDRPLFYLSPRCPAVSGRSTITLATTLLGGIRPRCGGVIVCLDLQSGHDVEAASPGVRPWWALHCTASTDDTTLLGPAS